MYEPLKKDEVLNINKEAIKKMNNKNRYIQAVVDITRDITPTAEYVEVSLSGFDVNIYKFWNSQNKQAGKTKKHCGNKKQYVMLYPTEFTELAVELRGWAITFSLYLEWNTGKINASIRDIAKKEKVDKTTVSRNAQKLVEAGFMYRKGGKYYIDYKYISKGGAVDEA